MVIAESPALTVYVVATSASGASATDSGALWAVGAGGAGDSTTSGLGAAVGMTRDCPTKTRLGLAILLAARMAGMVVPKRALKRVRLSPVWTTYMVGSAGAGCTSFGV